MRTLLEQSILFNAEDSHETLSKLNIGNHLHQIGYVRLFDVWLPHKKLLGCISVSNDLNKNIDK